MSSIDIGSLNRSTELFNSNKERLQITAWDAITDIKRTASEISLICAVYCERWKAVIVELYSQASEDVEELRAKGLEATFVASSNHYVLEPYLRQSKININFPTNRPDADNIWVLILHEHGHNWMQLAVKEPPKLSS
jgi:hypothetical protein